MTDSVSTPKQKSPRRMVPLRYVLTPFAIIFAAIIILMIVRALAPKPAKKPIVVKAPLVEVVELAKQNISFSIVSQGSVMPRTETSLISEVSGNVIAVSDKFKVGGFFKQGEELLRIDDITYQVAVLKAESQLDSAQAELAQEKARVKQAKDEWLLTGKTLEQAPSLALRTPQLQQAKASVKSAEAGLKEAQIKLERTRIVAPYDAMLKQKNVDIGQYVTTGSAIATTFAVDYAEVRLPIKQHDVDFLNLPKINDQSGTGSTVELFYEINGKKHSWASMLTRYEGVVDMSSRVHYVVAQVNDPYGIIEHSAANELRIGTFVNANITGRTLDGLVTIPRRSVHGANTIYLVDENNKLNIKNVNVVRAEVDYVYTRDDIPAGQRLVVTNITTPVNGMTVRVSGEEPVATVAEESVEDAQGDKS